MSFVRKDAAPLDTPVNIARRIDVVVKRLGMSPIASVIALMCIAQESGFWCPWNAADPSSKNYPNDSQADDGRSVGYFQQQNGKAADTLPPGDAADWWGPMSSRMSLEGAAERFLRKLPDRYRFILNGSDAGSVIQQVQRSAFPDAYTKHWQLAQDLIAQARSGAPAPVPNRVKTMLDALAAVRPDFNEYPNWSDNCQSRNGTAPDLWLNHTEEGNMNADSLVTWMKDNGVSYHYAGSQDPVDGGVTIVDMVDTDDASWSVMNSNNRAINFCYAGSYSNWTRDTWMSRAGKVIDVAAYLFVQDCIRYPSLLKNGVPQVIVPYTDGPGLADHRYCSLYLKDGNNHGDVGGPQQPPWTGFPWDYQANRVAYYWSVATAGTVPVTPNPTDPTPVIPQPQVPTCPTGDAALRLLLEQQLGPWDDVTGRFTGWPQLGGDVEALKVLQGKVDAGVALSQVDALAVLRFKLTPQDSPKKTCTEGSCDGGQ